jgi:hypothetical protein
VSSEQIAVKDEKKPSSSAISYLLSPHSFRLLFWGCTLLYVLPVWLARFLPFVDLPQHLAFVNILRNFNNPATDYARTCTLQLFPQHNVLHLFICYPLSFLVGIEGANRLFLTGAIILLPLAVLHLLRTLNARREFVFFSFLFIYNLNLLWGFLSTVLAIPLVLFLLSLELRWLGRNEESGSRKVKRSRIPLASILLLSVLFILIFLGHSLMFLFAAVLYLVVLIAAPGDRKRRLLALIPLALVLAVFVIPWQTQAFGSSEDGLMSMVLGGFELSSLLARPLHFIADSGFRADDVGPFIHKFLLVIAFTMIVIQVVRNRFRSLFRGRLLVPSLLILLSFAGYLFFPDAVSQAWFLNQRFAVFCWLFLIPLAALLAERNPQIAQITQIASGPESTKSAASVRKGILLVSTFILLVDAGNTLYRCIGFDLEAKPLAHLIARLPADRKVIGLPYELRTKPDLTGYEVFMHSGCYYQAFKRGYPGFSFASVRFSPIQYRDPSPFLELGSEWSPWYAIFPEGWQFYDYYLVHGDPRMPTKEDLDRMDFITREDRWSLYQRPDTSASR